MDLTMLASLALGTGAATIELPLPHTHTPLAPSLEPVPPSSLPRAGLVASHPAAASRVAFSPHLES